MHVWDPRESWAGHVCLQAPTVSPLWLPSPPAPCLLPERCSKRSKSMFSPESSCTRNMRMATQMPWSHKLPPCAGCMCAYVSVAVCMCAWSARMRPLMRALSNVSQDAFEPCHAFEERIVLGVRTPCAGCLCVRGRRCVRTCICVRASSLHACSITALAPLLHAERLLSCLSHHAHYNTASCVCVYVCVCVRAPSACRWLHPHPHSSATAM